MANLNAVIEFGTSKIICLLDSKASRDLDMPGSSCVRYEGLRRGNWVNSETLFSGLELAVETAEKRASRQIHSIFAGLPASCAYVETREIPSAVTGGSVTADLLNRMAEAGKRNDPKLILTDVRPVYFIDDKGELYVDLPINQRTSQLKATFSYVYAKRQYVEDVASMLDSMHIFVDRYIYEPYAQAVKMIPEKDRLKTVVLVDVGYQETSVSVIYNDAVLGTAMIGMGGQTFVNDLRSQLHVSGEVAEHLKRNHSFGISIKQGSSVYAKNSDGRMESYDQNMVSDIMEARMYRFAEAVKTVLSGFVRKRILSRNAAVYLSGAGLHMRGADIFLQNCIHKRVQRCQLNKRSTFAPVYNTALNLLDCSREEVYDLCTEVYHGQIKHKIGKFIR